ncbi:MAG: polyprenyl synthetase family protein [Ignavibacteria bacterium]|jgi:octaprenyl-diphosphate synthase|nr:polyprenyl synthetase family protein [Ignavibacteria bacterium]
MTFEQILQTISSELTTFETHFDIMLTSEVSIIHSIIAHINTNRGKRLRPSVMFLIANVLGKVNNRLMDDAAMIEILHTATLIHDDIVDEATQRRNQKSINARWDSKVAVLMGDFLYTKAFMPAFKNEEYEFLHIVSHAAELMSEGELLAIQLSETLDVSEEQYYRIINAKTASLIAAACQTSAMVYSENEVIIDTFREYGRNVGMAFQMKDDIFDYSDNASVIGKPVGNDIREHKLTLPLIHALSIATDSKRSEILDLIRQEDISDNDVKQVVNFAISNNGIEVALTKAAEYANAAIKSLDIIPDSKEKDCLIGFAKYMYQREK